MKAFSGFKKLTYLMLPLVLTSCLGPDSEFVDESNGSEVFFDPSKLVCDIFGNSASGGMDNGVKASLYYLEPDQPQYNNVADYIEFGTQIADKDIYFNQIYVPTRPFDRGFVSLNGSTVLTTQGDTLYEYFALRFNGRMQLDASELAGDYQLAILSDDGAVLKVDSDGDGVLEEIVNNDGDHPTRMACAASSLSLDANSKIDFQLDYYQGPRYHISAILLWRPWPADPNDPECGRQGNSRYFNFANDPPTPTSTFDNLIARGWKVLTPQNYLLPDEGDQNQCNAPAPVISGIELGGLSQTAVSINWQTDIQATSKVKYKNLLTSEEFVTDEVFSFTTSHTVNVQGLSRNTLYEATAVSASASGQESESAPIIFRTLR